MILVTVAAIYWSWTWVERILRLVPNEEKIDDTQLSADDKGDRKRKLLIARSSSWALEMSRGNTMMLLYVMIKNEISQVKETNVHIPKGDSIPFLSVCPLSSIVYTLRVLVQSRNQVTLTDNSPWFFIYQKQWKNVWILWILKQWRIFLLSIFLLEWPCLMKSINIESNDDGICA